MSQPIQTLADLRQAAVGYRAARIIQIAVRFRLFDHTVRPATAAEVAAAAAVSLRGADVLLDAVASLGLLEKEDGRYRNTELAGQVLLSDSESMLVRSIDHSEQLYRAWVNLDLAVRDGSALEAMPDRLERDREGTRRFILAMHAGSLPRGRALARLLDLTGVRRVLDVAGGAGSYLVALAELLPGMEGRLVDLPPTLEVAAEILAGHGLEGRFELRARDIFAGEAPFGEGYDLAILANILHIEGPAENTALLARIRRSLRPGGRLVIQDFLLDDSGTRPFEAALFAVNMLVNTERGRSWRAAEVCAWLQQAGFGRVMPLEAESPSSVWVAEA